MHELLPGLKTMNDDGIEVSPLESGEIKPGLTIIIGGCNSVHAHNVVQLNAEKLPETIEAVASGLKDVPPEAVEKLAEPIANLMNAIAALLARTKAW